MNKHNFSFYEKYAVWSYHGQECYWCGEPLRFMEATIDHVIPEHLLEKPKEREQIYQKFGLPDTVEINSYENWLPCHMACNQEKSGRTFKPTMMFQALLEKLEKASDKVKGIEARTRSDANADRLLGKVAVAIESGHLSKPDLLRLIESPDFPDKNASNCREQSPVSRDTAVITQEFLWHLDLSKWKIAETLGETVSVSNGTSSGIMPTSKNPDVSWLCPNCFSYGPWNGCRCITCNHISQPD